MIIIETACKDGEPVIMIKFPSKTLSLHLPPFHACAECSCNIM